MFSILMCLLGAVPSFAATSAVTLDELVLVHDQTGEDKDFEFPVRAMTHEGQLFLERLPVRVSKNCRGQVTVVRGGLVTCDPFGDKSKRFAFARIKREQLENDSSSLAYFLEYRPGAAKLVTHYDKKNARNVYLLWLTDPVR